MKTKVNRQRGREQQISNLKAQIEIQEKHLAEHRRILKEDTTIDFYEIERRQNAGVTLINSIKKAKKKLAELENEK